jgi:rhodanese-related sulfurtransferase
MKELNRTDRLTIATILLSVILIIGLVTYKQPQVSYKLTVEETLAMLETSQPCISPDEVNSFLKNNDAGFILVDLRSPSAYQKSHIGQAINIPIQEILEKQHLEYFNDLHNQNKTIVLYANDQTDANAAWMVLQQAGFDRFLIMEGGYESVNPVNEEPGMASSFPDHSSEKAAYDFKEIMKSFASPGSARVADNPEPVKLIKKAKKSTAEGGC